MLEAIFISYSNFVQRLSDSWHEFDSITGVLDHALSMLRPSCPENLALYKQIERDIGILMSQIFARVPTALGNCSPPVSPHVTGPWAG